MKSRVCGRLFVSSPFFRLEGEGSGNQYGIVYRSLRRMGDVKGGGEGQHPSLCWSFGGREGR